MSTPANPAIQLLENFFQADMTSGYFPQPNQFIAVQAGPSGCWILAVTADPDGQWIRAVSELPAVVPPERRGDCLDLLNRLNCRLRFGNFELDAEEGTISFRTLLDWRETGTDLEQMRLLVGSNLLTVEESFGAIMRVVYAGMKASQALRWKGATTGAKASGSAGASIIPPPSPGEEGASPDDREPTPKPRFDLN